MSDIFDHEADAWDEQCFHEERYYDDPDCNGPRGPRKRFRVNQYTSPARLEVHTVLRCSPEQVVVVAQTDKALLLNAEGTDNPAWFPRSQMEGDCEVARQTVPTWLGVRIAGDLGHL